MEMTVIHTNLKIPFGKIVGVWSAQGSNSAHLANSYATLRRRSEIEYND